MRDSRGCSTLNQQIRNRMLRFCMASEWACSLYPSIDFLGCPASSSLARNPWLLQLPFVFPNTTRPAESFFQSTAVPARAHEDGEASQGLKRFPWALGVQVRVCRGSN